MKDYRRTNDHINKKIDYRINKNYLRDNMFINGFDSDGIEKEVKNGDKVKIGTPVDYIITNNTSNDVNLRGSLLTYEDEDYELVYDTVVIPGKQKYNSRDVYYDTIIFENTTYEIELTSNKTTFYKVTYDNQAGEIDGFELYLGYFRGMYNYPKTEFNLEIPKGMELAVPIVNTSGIMLLLEIYDADSGELLIDEYISGNTTCASRFELNSNIRVVIKK